MPSYPFFEYQHPIYQKSLNGWKREEARHYGGDAVINSDELRRWKGEEDDSYDARLAEAGYITLPKNHTALLTGHLSRETPIPNFAEMGKVRKREEVTGTPSLAELFWYNVGIGADGEEMLPWIDGVQERAMATGFRWVLIEKPSMQTLAEIRALGGRRPDGPVTLQDQLDGFRPYPVEISPIDAPFWRISNRRLDCICFKIDLNEQTLPDSDPLNWMSTRTGWYLLVRRGFRGLGDEFAMGGWWKFSDQQEVFDKGNWDETDGQIPVFPFIGEPSQGTTERPAMGRSLTMELGQIAVSLMNRMSERNYNIKEAAKSINYILGIEAEGHGLVVKQQNVGSITVGVPPVLLADGRVGIPAMWNSSASLLDASAFDMVIKGGMNEAREIMVKQITSAPDSSGLSKEAGFAEATSPLLARAATSRQQAMNTLLHFLAQRSGIRNPTANVEIKRDFKLLPAVDAVDSMMGALKRSWLRSTTWEQFLLTKRGEETGMLPEDKALRAKIQTELEESATLTQPMDPLADDAPDTPGREAPQAEAPQPRAA